MIKRFSRICSWTSTSFMESHLIPVDQGHLGPIEPRQLSGCSNVLGSIWLSLSRTKATLTRSQFVKQSKRWSGLEIASSPSQVILL